MAENTKESRIAKLKSVAEARKRDACDRAEKAIRRLLLSDQPLSFANVAHEAQLSVAYLYKYPEIQGRIRQLRAQQDERGRKKITVPAASDRSQQVVIAHLRQRIKELEIEREVQTKHIAALTGQLYELSGAKDSFERLRDDNSRLSKRVQELEADRVGRKPVPPTLSVGAEMSDTVKSELAKIDIRLTPTLSEKLSSFSETRVLNAIAVVREAASAGHVRSPLRLFIKALEQGWQPAEDAAAKREAAEFSCWFAVARASGLVKASRRTERGLLVLTTENKWVPYLELCNRNGWTFSDLRSCAKGLTQSRDRANFTL